MEGSVFSAADAAIPKLQDLSIFSVTVYLIVLARSNLLPINVLYAPSWSMPAQSGFSMQLRT